MKLIKNPVSRQNYHVLHIRMTCQGIWVRQAVSPKNVCVESCDCHQSPRPGYRQRNPYLYLVHLCFIGANDSLLHLRQILSAKAVTKRSVLN